MQVPLSIAGLTGQDVQLVLSNETQSDIALPASTFRNMSSSVLQSAQSEQFRTPLEATIAEFNRKGWYDAILEAQKQGRSAQIARPNYATSYMVNDTRSFYYDDTSQPRRNATLVKQVAASDGRTVNIWVETTEYAVGKVTSAIVDTMANHLTQSNGTYDSVKSLGGPLWGPHAYTNLISDTGRPLDIVLLNFDNNGAAYGVLAYFWSMHNFLSSAQPNSNESLSVYLDTETLYKDGADGLAVGELALAHELTHMSNFYRRSISMGDAYAYGTWLEEMTAMMTEDLVSLQLGPYSSFRDLRLPQYLGSGIGYASFNCSLQVWTAYAESCESYSVSGSFGGFLLRQLGVGFFKNLLTQPRTNSLAALDAAIKSAAPTSSVGEQFRRFAASAAGAVPATGRPAGYGFPARTDSGFLLPEVDASAFESQRRLPSSTPSVLKAFATHPVVRTHVTGTFSDTVTVPPGASLSVVIH